MPKCLSFSCCPKNLIFIPSSLQHPNKVLSRKGRWCDTLRHVPWLAMIAKQKHDIFQEMKRKNQKWFKHFDKHPLLLDLQKNIDST